MGETRSVIADRLRTQRCVPHRVWACERCIAREERYAAWWAAQPSTVPELGWDLLEVEHRNEITLVGYCKCGRWFRCTDAADRRRQVNMHAGCVYRHQIRWTEHGQMELF